MSNKYTWKKIDPNEYFSNIQIPDDWANLEEFADWYLDNRMPLMIPYNAEVSRTDDAVAVCLFRKGNYQVELYLEYAGMWIRPHAHPRMEVITMQLGGGSIWPADKCGVSKSWGILETKLTPGNVHGGDQGVQVGNGFVTFAFQRWENPEEMSSAAAQWQGELQGPYHGELIKRKHKNALVLDNYADVANEQSDTDESK